MVKAQPDKRVEHVQSGTNTRMGKSEQANENQGGAASCCVEGGH